MTKTYQAHGISYPLVTIGIPTYNRASGYLRETLESALAQDYPNLEIIVSDNCSTDNTQTLVTGYGDPRVSYVRQRTPLIPNDHFNFCLAQARGAYFLLLHDDDLIDHDFVESCLETANYESHFGVIRTGTRIIDANSAVIKEGRNDVVGLSPGDFFLAWFAGRTSQYLCGTLFNTRALKEIGGLRSRHNCFQDVMAVAKLLVQLGRVDVPVVKASARWHRAKWTHVSRVKEWCEDSFDLLDLLCQLVPDHEPELRENGLRFFAQINYRRANSISSPIRRLTAYSLVYRMFGRRYLPRWRTVLSSTAAYRGLRQIKRRISRRPAWVD